MNHNYASYQPGTFTMDVSQFTPGDRLFAPEDMPAFLHEYCHFIQDVSTISGIFGFSLWMRDLVDLTSIFSAGEGKIIALPLGKSENGQPINQYRKFYNLFCGQAVTRELDYSQIRFKEVISEDKPIFLGTEDRILRLNKIIMDGLAEPLEFRLISLQEIHACYAQQLAERHYMERDAKIVFKVPAARLPSYPYHFGDHLFEAFGITMPLELKFIFVGLCLDTIQAPTVFLQSLEIIKGKTFITEDAAIKELTVLVEQVRGNCSYSNEEAMANILPDLERWALDDRRPDLAAGLQWYTMMLRLGFDSRTNNPAGFDILFCQGINALSRLYAAFPAPAFLDNGVLNGNGAADGDAAQDELYEFAYRAASNFWMLRKLYDLLCSPDIDTLNARCRCPLYEHCTVRPVLGEDYICANSPWEIVKGRTEVPCAYGRAAVSMGLWQNSLEFNFDQ